MQRETDRVVNRQKRINLMEDSSRVPNSPIIQKQIKKRRKRNKEIREYFSELSFQIKAPDWQARLTISKTHSIQPGIFSELQGYRANLTSFQTQSSLPIMNQNRERSSLHNSGGRNKYCIFRTIRCT